jgi:hypothetical protein
MPNPTSTTFHSSRRAIVVVNKAESHTGRVWLGRSICVAADVCGGTTLLALWGAFFEPSSWWPTVAFALFVLYLVLNHVRFEAKASLGVRD